MENLNAYLDAARERGPFASDNQLAKALSLSRQRLSSLRHGHWLPSDEAMLRIAELAGERPLVALAQLNYWRTRFGPTKDAYRDLLALARQAAAVAVVGLAIFAGAGAPRPALALADNVGSLYIMGKKTRFTKG